MANFPDSAPSFANKTPGQTIASAHINALQDEVVAIGAGYVNGTARINSSNSTMAHISAGTSTISGLTATNSTLTNIQGTNSTITNATITNANITSALVTSFNCNSTSLVLATIATATSGSSGAATALPATPSGYIKMTLNGSPFVVPYYNP